MSPQEIVRSRFPDAEATYRQPVYALGQREPSLEGGWVVRSVRAPGAEHLGSGPTEEAAWTAAARTLRDAPSTHKLSFKEWLAEQARREGSPEERRRIIEDWKGAVTDLLAGIIKWLAEEDAEHVLKVETGQTRKEEEGLGVYEITALRINLGSRFVEVIPLGRNVVGGIGTSRDLGLRAEGRVDMRNRTRKYMLYRAASTDSKKWVIVDDDEYAVRDLTKESFSDALRDLLS